MYFFLRIWKDIHKKNKNCARHWILKQHEKLNFRVVFNLLFSFFLLEHTSGDDNDPRLKGRNCGFYYYYYYYSLLHHTSQKKAITKGEGEKPGWECSCVRGCVHVRVCVCVCVCVRARECVRICLGTSICKVESTIVLRQFHELEWEYKEWIWLNTGSRLNRVREKLYQWVPIWHSL